MAKHWRQMTGRIFYLIGLKRSGQHALIEWLANHYEGNVLLSNNFTSWPPKTWKVTHVFNCERSHIKPIRSVERTRGPVTHCDARVLTIEDPYKKYCAHELNISNDGEENLAIVRSFWNNAASRMKIQQGHSADWDERFPEWWSDLALSALENDGETLFVNFDRWDADPVYRRALHEILLMPKNGWDAAEVGKDKTAHKGYAGNVASSFDKWGPRGDMTKRWEAAMSIPAFRRLVASDEVDMCRDLNYQLFGWTLNKKGVRV